MCIRDSINAEYMGISKTAIDLIQKLLCRNPHNRLGARGAQEIKPHSFFKSIQWDFVLARKQKMMPIEPAIPKVITPPDIAEIAGGVEEEYHFKKWSFVSKVCLLYTSPSPRDLSTSRMPSSA
eukprot:TRINITY_DN46458_c0_g1_i1.p1 TRINITY_DN46458_c0_g1~~TRINITY_DN46458_c0_g1_i1.p1  ORF type:complete len:123 (-),score=30.45 TRINITY_DN46458_c0_g1_i1:125-493(-)